MSPGHNRPPIIDFSAHLYGNQPANRPAYVPTSEKPAIDASLFPVSPIVEDLNLDRSEILRGVEIPEIFPVFLGLRSIIVEKRLNRNQTELENLSERDAVTRHIGKSVLTLSGYSDPSDPLRPSTRAGLKTAGKVERLTKKRLSDQAVVSNIDRSYPESGQKLSIGERKNVSANTRAVEHHTRKTQRNDVLFSRIMSGPSKKTAKLLARRNSLVKKSMSIDLARIEDRGIEKRFVKASNKFDRDTGRAAAKVSIKLDRAAGKATAKVSIKAAKAGAEISRKAHKKVVNSAHAVKAWIPKVTKATASKLKLRK